MEESYDEENSVRFAGIINEKTFFSEPTALTKALDEFCPPNPSQEDNLAFIERLIYAKKLLLELHSLISINSLHIYLESPMIISQLEDIVWNGCTVEVLYPFKRPANCKVIHHSAGYSKIRINQHKVNDYARDPFENLKSESNNKLVSPVTVSNSLFKLLSKGIEQLGTLYKKSLKLEEFHTDEENKNCIVMTLNLTRLFLKNNAKKCEERQENINTEVMHANFLSFSSDKHNVSKETEHLDENEVMANNVSKESHEETQLVFHDEELEGREVEEEDFYLDVSNNIAQIFMAQAINQSVYDISTSNGIKIKLRFTPATLTPDPTVLLVGRHYHFDQMPHQLDLWRFSYSLKEAIILQRVFAADRYLRLRVTAGLAQLCASEPELKFLSYHHARQCLFYMLESEVDAVTRWQRSDLDVCLHQLLGVMRNAVLQRSLHFYFIKDLEMLFGNDLVNFTNAACRISLLFKSPNLLTRVVQRLATSKKLKDKNI